MKFFKLIRRNLFRNKLQAILTMLLLAAIFFLVATLMSILDTFDTVSNAGEGANRLVVQSAISLANPLPYAYEQKLRALPKPANGGISRFQRCLKMGSSTAD